MGESEGDRTASRPVRVAGRYSLYGTIAVGGMATVHFGRLRGPVGFARTVAIKRLHPQYASDPEFVKMFVDEARVAARLRHPNVVPIIDVVATNEDLLLVMDYVPGESLSRLLRRATERGERPPLAILSAIMTGVLHGLQAAHDATDERGEPLELVHRDVSPQNIIVGTDGHARLLDFGVAKAIGRAQITRDSQIKGKLAYMAREQVTGGAVTRSTDIYSAAVVLWEALTSKRLFTGENDGQVLERVLMGLVSSPSKFAPDVTVALDELTMRGLARAPSERFATAAEMASALETAVPPALASAVGAWVSAVASDALAARAETVLAIESGSADNVSTSVGAEESSRHAPSHAADATVVSQVSSISVSRPALARAAADDAQSARQRRRVLLTVLAASAALLVLLVVVVGRLHDSSHHNQGSIVVDSEQAPSMPTTSNASPSSAAPATASGESLSHVAEVALAGSSPSGSLQDAAVLPSHNGPGRQASPRPSPAVHSPSSTGPKGRCDPPYVVDATGKVTFKRECLH